MPGTYLALEWGERRARARARYVQRTDIGHLALTNPRSDGTKLASPIARYCTRANGPFQGYQVVEMMVPNYVFYVRRTRCLKRYLNNFGKICWDIFLQGTCQLYMSETHLSIIVWNLFSHCHIICIRGISMSIFRYHLVFISEIGIFLCINILCMSCGPTQIVCFELYFKCCWYRARS